MRRTGRFTLWAPTQGVMGSRANAAEMMNVPPEKMRFIATNVGGSFGMKGAIFPEYVCVMHAARTLGRPVKWTDKRSDSFLSDHHGRAQEFDCELALDSEGNFLAVRCTGFGDLGGYMTQIGPLFSTFNIVKHVNSCYRTPLIEVSTRCVFTNTVPVTAYRGAGRPEGNYYMERLIDTAAAEMGVDPVALRRRNHIQPDQIPYKAPSGSVYDSGNFPAILDTALEAADWNGFAARKADSARRGRLRGRGIGQFLEVTAPVQAEYGGVHFEADGSVTILTGSHDHGQGHWTTFAQIVATQLGVPFEKIRLMQTDSDQLKTGTGTGGSKSLMCSGTAFVEASAKVIEKGKVLASHMLEASVADIAFEDGRFAIAGTDRSISIMEIADRLNKGERPAPDAPDSLDVDHVGQNGVATYPNGCHVCEVEIDPDTGVVEVVEVHDGRRLRRGREPGHRRGPGAGRCGAGHWPVPHGGHALHARRPAGDGFVHGLRHAARGRCAEDGLRGALRPRHDQSSRREGLRRGRLRGLDDLGHERRRRCALGLRRAPHRHAGLAAARVGGHSRRQQAGGRIGALRRRLRPAGARILPARCAGSRRPPACG